MKLRQRKKQPMEVLRKYCTLGEDRPGFVSRFVNTNVGRGVFTTVPFPAKAFLLEYRGDFIPFKEGERREREYKPEAGSFMYFFKYNGKRWCVDATHSEGLGRLINDSIPTEANCKAVIVDDCPGGLKLCLFAVKDIDAGEELRYDYGVKDLPWRIKADSQAENQPVQKMPSPLEQLSFCGLREPTKRATKKGTIKKDESDDEFSLGGGDELPPWPSSGSDSDSSNYVPSSSDDESDVFEPLQLPSSRKASCTVTPSEHHSIEEECEKSCGSSSEVNPATSSGPKRPCVYCGEMQSQLNRHLRRRHKSEEEVKAALNLPDQERLKAMATLRKDGIYKENLTRLNTSDGHDATLLRERCQGSSEVVMCGQCRGFYSKHRIWRHKQICHETAVNKVASVPVTSLIGVKDKKHDMFQTKILDRFRGDEVGNVCRSDSMIINLGKKLWSKSATREKAVVMNDMRRLGHLLVKLRHLSGKPNLVGEDLIRRENFPKLEEALDELTEKESNEMKHGLRLSIGYLLKKAAKVMKAVYIIDGRHDLAEEVDRFLAVLDLSWDFLFNRSLYAVEGKRQAVLRKPHSMPLEEDIMKMKKYTIKSMNEIINDHYLAWDEHVFTTLRSLIVSRLTLFNARRGGEPARLTMSEWQDGVSQAWIDPQLVETVSDPMEKALLQSFKLMYQKGKGSRKLVPVLIPHDTLKPIQVLVEMRKDAGVSSDNVFLFAYTQKSANHVNGWSAIKDVTKAMGNQLSNPSNLTATKYRHRASTLYALLDVDEGERHLFYKHMGHSEAINKNVYQCPLAVKEITTVGRYLNTIDGKCALNKVHRAASALPAKPSLPVEEPSQSSADLGPSREDSSQASETSENSVPSTAAMPTSNHSSTDHNKDTHATGRLYTRWSQKETKTLLQEFKPFIQDRSKTGTKGSLPSKQEVLSFITGHPEVLPGAVNQKQRIHLIKVKVFNERTKWRNKVSTLSKI